MLRNFINEKAIESFQKALDINPGFESAQRNYRLSYYEKTGSEIFVKALTSKMQRPNDNGVQKKKNNSTKLLNTKKLKNKKNIHTFQ